jgi:hypothetical protein
MRQSTKPGGQPLNIIIECHGGPMDGARKHTYEYRGEEMEARLWDWHFPGESHTNTHHVVIYRINGNRLTFAGYAA